MRRIGGFPVAAAAMFLSAGLCLGCGAKVPAQAPDAPDPGQEGATAEGTTDGASKGEGGKKRPKHVEAAAEDPEDRKNAGANPCTGFELNLVDALSHATCEIPTPPADAKPRDLKGKLEVKVVPSATKIQPGGKVDLTLLVSNKGKGVLPLTFTVNPLPRFEVEAYDAKGNRVDVPAGDHPKWPGNREPTAPEEKTAEIKLAENGSGRVTLSWEAAKMKWAPEKAKGTAMGSAYPKAAAGPLPKGKYTVRVLLPLVGIFEGADREVSGPKVDIEVAK